MATESGVALYPWRVEALRKAWEAGANDAAVAGLLQVSHQTAAALRRSLGLPPVRRRGASEGARQRHCLMCGRGFPSHGIGNRVCGGCKQTDAWRSPGAAF